MDNKVLFTASTFSHILNFHLPYLQAFHERGWSVHVACGGDRREIPWADRVLSLPFEKQMWSPRNLKAAELLRRLAEDEGYALVITHTSLAAFFTRLAVRGLKERPKLINMVHGYLFDDATPAVKRSLLLTAERLMAPETDLLLTMNRFDEDLALRYRLGRRVVHIPGVGVDFSRFDGLDPKLRAELRGEYGIPDEAFVLIYPAEFSARKSQKSLIPVLERLPENVWFFLPGEGKELAACRELAQERGVDGRIVFPGYLDRIERAYAVADAAISASRSEGLPFNVMEAMAMGLPVVASAVKGHTDLIRDGESGLLYPYGDAQACAAQIERLLASEDLRRRLGASAHEDVMRFSLESVFPQVWEAYMSETRQELLV